MYLSRLELVGFKSFAQKTNLLFNDGITAIVGPNGCGKTNVVDGIRWVLGEQKSSTLRSDKMEDVIFNGTKARKPLGLSEVSMTIQNSRGILPTEYSEVTITRRLFRNGESQYLLNKTVCRLRDIIDLFMDTGMGANAYSVIELKMIETILSDKQDDRRRLFEEAAGITKYKTRRKEAERRLKGIQTDLSRVQDILLEVQKSVRSLSRQASKAKRHKELNEELLSLDRRILESEYARLIADIHPLETKRKESELSRETLNRELVEQESVVSAMEEDQSRVEIRLSEAESRLAGVNRVMADASRELAVAKERSVSLERSRERTIAECEELAKNLVEIERVLQETEQKQGILAERIAEAELEFQQRKGHQDESLAHVQESRGRARDSKSRMMAKMDEINALRATTERNRARTESLTRRIEETRQSMTSSEQRLGELSREYDTQVALRPNFERSVGEADKALADVQEYQVKLRREMDVTQQQLGEVQRNLSHKRASLEFLSSLMDTSESTEFLLGQEGWNSGTQRMVLAEAVGADEELRPAVAAALGDATDFIVVDTLGEARAGIQALRDNDKGKVTFVCLEKVPSMPDPAAAPAGEGLFGWVSELVRTEDRLRNTLRGLLGRTMIVDTLDRALRCVEDGTAACAVTLEGEIVRQQGVMLRGGGGKSSEGAMIGKSEQIESLQQDIAELESKAAALHTLRDRQRAEYNEIDLKSYSDAIRGAEAELSRHEQLLGKLLFEQEAIEQSIAKGQSNVDQFDSEIKAIKAQGGDNLPAMDDLLRVKEELETEVESAETELRKAEETFDEDSAEAHRAEMRLVQLRSEDKSLGADLDRLNNQLVTTKQRLEHRKREIDHAGRERERLTEEVDKHDTVLQETEGKLKQATAERNEVADEQATLRKSIQAQADNLRNKRQNFDHCVQELHEIELKLSHYRSQADQCRKRAVEEFHIELVKAPPPDDEQFDIEEARRRVRELKDKLGGIGAVNLLAFDEFEKESEREQFLQSQLNDLLESEKTLNQTIQEINQTAKRKFSETFDDIRANFVRIFRSLFEEGDEADLQLLEGDPLEAKVDIIAKPRGKRPHSIEMLSGGEKTLTAIALLFAIYLVKPSPFCILDEVDAPLDDANIDRYLRIIREFSANTQFIMITHNKRTMEAADTLYGVTMVEEGVSKLVSVQWTGDDIASRGGNLQAQPNEMADIA